MDRFIDDRSIFNQNLNLFKKDGIWVKLAGWVIFYHPG